MELPVISIITPTLNSGKTIGACLGSILNQDYPQDRIETIIAEGGSSDHTIDVINSSNLPNVKIVSNQLKTGEAGKAAALKEAKGKIIAFIDSDNMLPDPGWLKRMIEPFYDQEIVASEPIEYTYRKEDGYITRYSALLGMNDPLCLFIGNYDRQCLLSGKWTEVPHNEEDRGGYLKVSFRRGQLPTIGANGFVVRRDFLNASGIGDYLFDIDVLCDRLKNSGQLNIAKVKIGIIHIFSGGLRDFIRKQRRRIVDYAYYNRLGLRKYKWSGASSFCGTLKFIIFTLLIFPLFLQAITGYIRKPDRAWFFHIPACIITFFVYAYSCLQNLFIRRPFKRASWQA